MRAFCALLYIAVYFWGVNANVEKTIFLGPNILTLPQAHPGLQDLNLDVIQPVKKTSIRTKLPVRFPSEATPRGQESWYLLANLQEKKRYEVRVCWAATQPADFWLETFAVPQVFESPSLISSLAEYSESRFASLSVPPTIWSDKHHSDESVLLLRIQAAASYYSLNRTLMDTPLPVDVDIILDPFILNLLPYSLWPVAVQLCIAAIGAWYLSGWVNRWLTSIANEQEPSSKPHAE